MLLTQLDFDGIGEILTPEGKVVFRGTFKVKGKAGSFWPVVTPGLPPQIAHGFLSAGGNVLWPVKDVHEVANAAVRHYLFTLEI